MADSFVHLHNHTEYSMLDGAAKVGPLFKEAERLGMTAVGMTDHGNMYGASEFYNSAKKHGIKPIIGIEAYVAPESRFNTKRVLWGDPSQKSDDVSGSGAYTHMTMVAENSTGLRNLFKLSSLASIEGQLGKWPRMDEELIATHAEGIIATTGCPSGEIQTRLRLGHDREALEAAAKWQEIWGKDNFFLELMDHGLSIERRVREGLLSIGRQLGIPPLATNDCHYVTKDAAENHEALLCIQTGKTLSDPTRFKFDGDGYYLKSAEEMRAIWDSEVPGACDNSVLIGERVQPYEDVWQHRDRMPIFPVPEGETQASWLHKEVMRGLDRRFPAGQPRDWNRMRSLFVPGGRLMPTGPRQGSVAMRVLEVNDYIALSGPTLERIGFREREVARRTEEFGHIAHVFSTYEGRGEADSVATRGINSIQLMNDGARWWIVSVFWEAERPDNPLPEKYLRSGM